MSNRIFFTNNSESEEVCFPFSSLNERKENIRVPQTFGLHVVKLNYRQTETLRRARPVLG